MYPAETLPESGTLIALRLFRRGDSFSGGRDFSPAETLPEAGLLSEGGTLVPPVADAN
jgi:hypothetical protein